MQEIYETKKRFPGHALVVSLMVEPKREKWHEIVKKVEAVGVDGLELNFGCPHGMAERGMGSASGQQPDLVEAQTMWAKEAAKTPVIVKLTPNITDITSTAKAAVRGGADAISLINTINSLAGVDIDTWNTIPHVGVRVLMAATAVRLLNRLRCTWSRIVRVMRKLVFQSPELVVFLIGAMLLNSC